MNVLQILGTWDYTLCWQKKDRKCYVYQILFHSMILFAFTLSNLICQKTIAKVGAGSSNVSASSSSKEQRSQAYPGLSMLIDVSYLYDFMSTKYMQNYTSVVLAIHKYFVN